MDLNEAIKYLNQFANGDDLFTQLVEWLRELEGYRNGTSSEKEEKKDRSGSENNKNRLSEDDAKIIAENVCGIFEVIKRLEDRK